MEEHVIPLKEQFLLVTLGFHVHVSKNGLHGQLAVCHVELEQDQEK